MHKILITWICGAALFSNCLATSNTEEPCIFPASWSGQWFQSGNQHILVNSTSIETKGHCVQVDGDKFLIEDKIENCFRCVVIHEKHYNVLQYKETYCIARESLENLCATITGDAPLYSMFRLDAQPTTCPFKPPFTYTYNRGSGECRHPVSRVDPCTEDSRLLLRYQACPDVHNSESSVEELTCLAWWKDGSTRYLVGLLQHPMATADEDRYRCFVYGKVASRGGSYNVAQSGDATCNGLLSPTEGSRTLSLTKVESHHGSSRTCRFPQWLTIHHSWHTLDYSHSYHFSPRNGTLKVTSGTSIVLRAVCHSLLGGSDLQAVLVTHLTTGCQSGFACMMFYKREAHVIELQQSVNRTQNPEEACLSSNFNPQTLPYTTLITSAPRARKCPYSGRYTVTLNENTRLNSATNPSQPNEIQAMKTPSQCQKRNTQILSVGCTALHTMEFQTQLFCPSDSSTEDINNNANGLKWYSTDGSSVQSSPSEIVSAYSCHGDWSDGNGTTRYLIALPLARNSGGARRYCFVMYSSHEDGLVQVSSLTESCYRHTNSHLTDHNLSFNITPLGECSDASSRSASHPIWLVVNLTIIKVILR
ncbi:uncharacterized protein LOC142332859 [Lycorma delicatula]|uniref:uncharacterized protein LOC142332859 n=1 Tax=Lycorma delicatula TaxID=130591 RepID=UPI003F516EFE